MEEHLSLNFRVFTIKLVDVHKFRILLYVFSVKVASLTYSTVEQELFPLATRASEYLDRLYPSGRLSEVSKLLGLGGWGRLGGGKGERLMMIKWR